MGFFIFIGFLAGIGDHLFNYGVRKYVSFCGKDSSKEKAYERRYAHF
jgi:hypothetical protein